MVDQARLFWLHAATVSYQIALGVITIVWVVLLRRQSDPNAGIFALAAKVGIGSVGNKSSDHKDPTVYFKHPKLFDFLWILNHVAVIITASILLGFGLGHTQEGLRVTRDDLVNAANALWVSRTLLAQIHWLRNSPKNMKWATWISFVLVGVSLGVPVAIVFIDRRTNRSCWINVAITAVCSWTFYEAASMIPIMRRLNMPPARKKLPKITIVASLVASVTTIVGCWLIVMLPFEEYLPVVSFVCSPEELVWNAHCLWRYLRPTRGELSTTLPGSCAELRQHVDGDPEVGHSYHEAISVGARTNSAGTSLFSTDGDRDDGGDREPGARGDPAGDFAAVSACMHVQRARG